MKKSAAVKQLAQLSQVGQELLARGRKYWAWYRRRGVLTLSIVNAVAILLSCIFIAAYWLGGEPPSAQALSRWGSRPAGGPMGASTRSAGAAARPPAPAGRTAHAPQPNAAVGRREYEVKLRTPRQGAVQQRGAAPERGAVRVEGVEDEQPTLMRE